MFFKESQVRYFRHADFLSAHLHLHRLLDARRNVNVLDFISEAADPPIVRSLVDRVDDVGVEGLPFLQTEKTETSGGVTSLQSGRRELRKPPLP